MKVFSFDIFDTLLLRPYVNPQDVWQELEIQEKAAGFASARKKADEQTFADAIAHGRETTLDAAYRIMPARYAHLMQKEMDLERRILSPNPELKSMWEEIGSQGIRRVIVSDMYMPKSFIEGVLVANGFADYDALYLSSDQGVRKSTGKLFEVMLQQEGVSPAEVCHVGDNEGSDVVVPQKLGMHVRPYKKVSEQFFEMFPFARNVDKSIAGLLALGWHYYRCEHRLQFGEEPSYWNRIGYMFGGVLGYVYLSWIVKVAKERGIERLLFVARDGYVWQRICNELYPEMQTDYIYAPRVASIAVLGAVGADPVAIGDRLSYYKEHFEGRDVKTVADEYKKYIGQYHIDEHTAIVDGCSSGFSAQRLIENAIGHPVFSFYLLSMAQHRNAAALFSTCLYPLPFQHLVEFMFGAPENPVREIVDGRPVYETEVAPQEQFKIGVSREIADGASKSASWLHQHVFSMHPRQWIHYSDSFMEHLTDEDLENLEKAQNAPDVRQKYFTSVIWNPQLKPQEIVIRRVGRAAFRIKVSCGRFTDVFFISPREFHREHKSWRVRYMIINK